jgi:hypothetical protein
MHSLASMVRNLVIILLQSQQKISKTKLSKQRLIF